MYDRLNDSNNSNDGRDIKHVQERPQKRKWHEKNQLRKKNKEDRVTTKKGTKITDAVNVNAKLDKTTHMSRQVR